MDKNTRDVIKEIISIGLAKSADSLSFFTQSKVIFKGFDLEFKKCDDVEGYDNKKSSKVYILTTDIIGDINGACYLLFSEDEVKELVSKNISASVLEDEEQFLEISNGLLLELDNIVTASVVTQFSNLLGKSAYGDVPKLDIVKDENTFQFMSEKLEMHDSCLCFKTIYEVDNMDLQPIFVWALGDDFVNSAKEKINSEKVLIN